jgi:hypothetical protein
MVVTLARMPGDPYLESSKENEKPNIWDNSCLVKGAVYCLMYFVVDLTITVWVGLACYAIGSITYWL